MSISKENYEKLKVQFGDVASWAIWKEPGTTPTSNTSDLTVFDALDILNTLGTGYVFVGLNAANHKKDQNQVAAWSSFHSAYRYQRDFRLRYALIGDDRFWGSYITDIIKGYEETDSRQVIKAVREGDIDLNEQAIAFEQEIAMLGDSKPVLIALGNSVYDILKQCFNDKYIIFKIPHYSSQTAKSKEDYRDKVQEALKDCKKLS